MSRRITLVVDEEVARGALVAWKQRLDCLEDVNAHAGLEAYLVEGRGQYAEFEKAYLRALGLDDDAACCVSGVCDAHNAINAQAAEQGTVCAACGEPAAVVATDRYGEADRLCQACYDRLHAAGDVR